MSLLVIRFLQTGMKFQSIKVGSVDDLNRMTSNDEETVEETLEN